MLMIDDIVNLEEDELRRFAAVEEFRHARTGLYAVGVNHHVVDDDWFYPDVPMSDEEEEDDYEDEEEDTYSGNDGNCSIM